MNERTKFELLIDGMHCQACVRRVTAALAKLPGVEVEAVEIGSAKGSSDGQEPPEALAAAVAAIGFPAHVVG